MKRFGTFSSSAIAVAVLALTALFAFPVPAEEQDESLERNNGWLVWYKDALAQSEETGKPILVNFTGSDWCPPCKALKKDVYSKDAFKAWAAENVILLELDYPRQKPQSDKMKEQNRQLAQAYKIRGFPTAMVIDAEGKELERFVGHGGMDLEGWIERTQKVVDKYEPSEQDPA